MKILRSIGAVPGLLDIRILLVIVLALHLFAMSFPRDTTVFDESFYVPAARDLISGVPSNMEHPFFGKAWTAVGIILFGDNWFGWRIFQITFSTASLYLVFLLARQFLDGKLSLYAASLLGFENMFFIHGNLALLEASSLFFGILGVYLYFTGKYWYSSVAFGLSILSKETGLLLLLVVVLYHVASNYQAVRKSGVKVFGKHVLYVCILSIVFAVPVSIYDQVYDPPMESVVKLIPSMVEVKDEEGGTVRIMTSTQTVTEKIPISNAIEHVVYMAKYASSLTIRNGSTVDKGNYAWNWVVPAPNPFPPMQYYVLGVNRTVTTLKDGVISEVRNELVHPIVWQGMGNLPIWWSIWIVVPTVIYCLIRARNAKLALLLLSWVSATYLPWLYLSGVVGRIVYPFYFVNTVPALVIGIPFVISEVSRIKIVRNLVLLSFMITVLVFFIAYFPVRPLEQ